ncbi:hypothetical protein GCM10011349_09140 [Novosphingobium indicum]|uniref:Uncharacterized protein n=1 Tax=Novosphingobium indicum TaxID=462949 RepID=A0ABQ2JBS4_9SPHN|nr:hypothetical protein [Novosphingobium indicum]GGN44256.1 hypothetical protein GCM10011349_09140 [Novosphingobium indicum]
MLPFSNMLSGLCVLALALLLWVPASPPALAVRRTFVMPLARWLNAFHRGHGLLLLAALAILALAVFFLDQEAMHILAMAAPEYMTWASTFEAAIWVDALVTTLLVTSGLRAKAGLAVLRSATCRTFRIRLRDKGHRRTVRPRRVRPDAANDDDGGRRSLPRAA